jgi:ribosomal protein L29
MKKIDLNNKTKEELSHTLADLNSKLLKLNFDLADNKLKDVSQLKKTKKDIARVMTMLSRVNK